MSFSGSAYLKDRINKLWYLINSWTLPPFGNEGRGYVERYLSRDYVGYLDMSGPRPVPKAEYMPMIFDREDIFTDLDCFSTQDMYSPVGEPFSNFPILSTALALHVGESISANRYRFEDIIQPINHANCMYPYPLIVMSNLKIKVIRYGFLNENHVWAWPEYWEEIERNIDSDYGKFNFVNILRPEYYFDEDKYEHRMIIDEGDHVLIFEPPKPSGDDGDPPTYPSISIDGQNPRFFKIVYNSYSSVKADWQDESASGEDGGSGGGNIYEEANNGYDENGVGHDHDPLWIHNFDTLFDGEATSDPVEDRKAYLGEDVDTGEEFYGYYNRGLIAHIYRDRLKFLPMKVTFAGSPSGEVLDPNEAELILYWFSGNFGEAPVEISVTGVWGTDSVSADGPVYSLPGVRVVESEDDIRGEESIQWPDELTPVISTLAETGVNRETDTFTMDLQIDRVPSRFVKTWEYFMVKLVALPGETLSIDSVRLRVGKYVRATETIKVWERKYYVGESSTSTPNADGPNTKQYRSYDRDNRNAGQYYPFVGNTDSAGEVKSKLTIVSFGEHEQGDIEVPVTFSTLKDVERDVQREEYEQAYSLDNYDTIIFSGVIPPAIKRWFEKIGDYIEVPSGFYITYKKIDWDHNYINNLLRQDGDFWQPGGHYFAWSEDARRTRCYMTGPVQDVYDVDWIHHRHGGREASAWTGHSFAGFVRLDYYEGRLWQKNWTGYEGWERTDLLTGAINFIYEI